MDDESYYRQYYAAKGYTRGITTAIDLAREAVAYAEQDGLTGGQALAKYADTLALSVGMAEMIVEQIKSTEH